MRQVANWWSAYEPFREGIRPITYERIKRGADIFLIAVTSPAWVPLFVVCSVLILLSSPGGPVLFKQWRTGKGGKRFRMFKFRTMVPDAEKLKERLLEANELSWPDFKMTNDPRVTPLGKFLRKTSLDELPQVLNVMAGDMTLVGPRPTSFSSDAYDLWQTERLEVKPGLTGIWQVIGRGEMDFVERSRLDIAYVRRRSLGLDLLILCKTVLAVIRREGAK